METDTIKLTIRLPRQDVEFVKAYARAHGLTVTEVIDRYLRRMRALPDAEPSPEIDAITGLVSAGADVEREYRDHSLSRWSTQTETDTTEPSIGLMRQA